MKLSILDQAPISAGKAPRDALVASLNLAQTAEKLGYERYWIAEHHDFPALACPAPEVMLSYIGAQTSKIRIGSGAVLLPHYKPYKIAETYNLLATLFPDRIDLGIGRAPGGSAEATMALSDNYLAGVNKMPEATKELLQFLRNDISSDPMYSKVLASPLPPIAPLPWILGTSEKSAILAAENGTPYAFGHFMSEKDGVSIMEKYVEEFKGSDHSQKPQSILCISVICAETTEKAEELALSNALWKIKLNNGEGRDGIPSKEEARQYSFIQDENNKLSRKMIIGNPKEVKEELLTLQTQYKADEMMIVTITHRYEDRAPMN
ncbi:LLM class flavin-dependent oxidoreductase [Alkalihalophilus lindianensis]|uniref:LLM class flavin-dependent oxidoreductase n=2 Tax=Alkalihalophilus TaxID=2893060 RepID=A0ABU3X5C1_9BACI|nr:LLM class flavin-dependent oxidoreductase [Alkalihalophilus lindianensis]MDV2683091.1 LLM class flavin-dependent oxidoreductase [Alkalihalophilus lindianensis]